MYHFFVALLVSNSEEVTGNKEVKKATIVPSRIWTEELQLMDSILTLKPQSVPSNPQILLITAKSYLQMHTWFISLRTHYSVFIRIRIFDNFKVIILKISM